LTAQTVLNKKLGQSEQKLLTSLIKKINVLKWTKNNGLKLSHNGKELYVVDVKDDTLDLALNIILSATNDADKNNHLKKITSVLPNFKERDQAENSPAPQKESILSEKTVYKAFATFKMGCALFPKNVSSYIRI
jgi:hypothetical protein